MSKPFVRRNQPPPQHWSSNHDNRTGGDRRVSFKPSRHGGKHDHYSTKDWTSSVRAHLQDEDVDMMGVAMGTGRNFSKKYNRNKKKGSSRRSGSPAPHKRKLPEGPTGWYKVFLPHGDKYEKPFLQKILLEKLAPLPFWPLAWEAQGTNVNFFVDDYAVAEKLYGLDKQIQLPNGFRLFIRVQAGLPTIEMRPDVKEKMKLVMARRYVAETRALDLTKFHADPELQNMTCALFKPVVFLAVIDIIAENIPELEALKLDDNKISTLNFLKKTIKKLSNLKILHMENNKLRDVIQLDALSGLPIVDLILNGNPLCDKFKDQSSYISAVRKRLPKVIKLDGIDLPPPISFDISEDVPLPPTSQNFLCNPEGGPIVRQFLEQYFELYDSDNREPLMQAYSQDAMFSMTTAYPYGYGKEKNVAWLSWYLTDNRNILKVADASRRYKLLQQGQLQIVSFLQDMPKTKHDIHSFTVDLTLFTPAMIVLTVSGMFKELKTGQKIPPLRFFFRTFVIVPGPGGNGFKIANEQIHITNPIPEQAAHAFETPILVAPPPTPEPSAPVVQVPDEAMQQEMVKQICERTGMNVEYSLKCLQESQWDFFRATSAFDTLNAQGVVPPEAFIKPEYSVH